MNKNGVLVLTGFLLLYLITGCSHKPVDGFRPPLSKNPLETQQNNWNAAKLLSGFYKVTFQYSNGEKITLKGDTVIEPDARTRMGLVSDFQEEAVVTITPEFINLLNHREKYFIREQTSISIAEQMIGLYLPAQEAASVLCGKGFNRERFEQIYSNDLEGGSKSIQLFHAQESLKTEAVIDQFGRLRLVKYIDTTKDVEVINARYLEFRHDSKSGLIWPTYIVINLPQRGERITMIATNITINNEYVLGRLEYTFARLERGKRLYLENIPPGEPLLYRNLKNYVADNEK